METKNTPQATSGKTGEKTREKILRLIAEDPTITMAELAEQIGVTAKGVEPGPEKLTLREKLNRLPVKHEDWSY